MNKKTTTLFEQVIIAAERTRELREQRYGALDTGMFDPGVNKRLPRLVDQSLNEIENQNIGREYLFKSIERKKSKERTKRR